MNDYDAIVVGAGNAGLTAATTLQRSGARTLLIERHNIPGGCATSFRRGRFEFEVALHQLSGVGVDRQPMSLRAGLFEELGIAETLEFVQEHDLYRAVVPGHLDVTLPADWDGAIQELDVTFPGNHDRLHRFFDLVRDITVWQIAAMRGTPAEQIDPVLFRHGLRPAKDVLDEHFNDRGIKHALAAYWVYLGQPPERLPFQDLALMLFAYLEFKPWHIRGGSQTMSAAILDRFVRAGGEVMFNTGVTAILTDGCRVRGVRIEGGVEIAAPDVVSNTSLPTTYGMCEGIQLPAALRTELEGRRIGPSAFVLHMGLDATAAELGFTTSTTFINRDIDESRAFRSWSSLEPARGICATSYDVTPIGFAPSGTTHVALLTLQYADMWRSVAPADYARTKFTYAQSLLDLAETMTPGIRDAIEEVDVATPVTMMRYLGHPGGAIYGYDQDATASWLFRNSERETHIPGLHLAGSWSGMGGFQPTLESGARVARRLLRARAAA